ncbi:YhgE/Pip domain-containing protein [Brachybacterium fresconis]|uniref:Membrane protein n=1 Tax=Brachybacterium fresconis TaxID=173363 RepID=A0ABS4YF91_9MICO|nr:YhgE/Pip domain-containing protein [Brachybacterium fresconis]MBP2407444.1 putative membrane protein [Brachybacterium fresconis]
MTRLKHPRTLLVVLLLPLLVAGLGLWALSGRVDRLDTVPAAVVNLDEGAEVTDADGETQTVPFGRLLSGSLTQPGTVEGQDAPETTGFDWQLTSQDDAEQGLKDGTYSAVVVVPEDFSAKLTTIGTTDAVPAILEVTTNDASGQINALVGSAVAEASASTMGGQMAQQYLDGLYLGFNDLKDGFSESADGAEQLADGTSDLDDGAHELADGTAELADGTTQAAEGTKEFSGGVWSLADGAGQTAEGTQELADGLDDLATGASGAAGGGDDLATGLDDLATGAEDLATGVHGLQTGMSGTDSEPGLLDGANQLAAGVEGDGTEQNPGLAAGADQLATGLEQYADGVSAAGTAVTGDGTAENPGLVTTAEGVADGTAELGEGAQQLADGIQGTETEPGLPEASQQVADGAAELSAGIAGDGTDQDPGMVALAEQMQASADALLEENPEDPNALALQAQAEGMLSYAQGVETGLNGDGTAENPGLVAGTQGVADGSSQLLPLGAQVQDLADGINGTDQQPGLVQGTQGMLTYAQGLETAFAGDGTEQNPGLTASAEQLATGARASADGSEDLVTGVTGLRDGLQQYSDGVDDLAEGADQLAEGTRASADGAGDLATGLDDLAAGTRSSADGAGTLADGSTQLADGATELGHGSDQLASGSEELAAGSGELADGTEELADGTEELAGGSDDLASGLREGAEGVPSYTESERDRMSEMAANPVTTDVDRQNEADGATTATFPFVTALALWLGAFASFLLLPALSRRLLDRAVPMGRVVLRSLAPALLVAVVQTIAVLAVLTAVGISPVSPVTVGVVALAGAGMFAALHQALMTLLGDRIGRIVSIVVMVLQVVTLVGIVPLATAPPLLQSVSALLPLPIVTQGLVHAALGGSLVSTSGTLLSILAWAAVSLVVTFAASRTARRADRSDRVPMGTAAATA